MTGKSIDKIPQKQKSKLKRTQKVNTKEQERIVEEALKKLGFM